MNTYELRVHEFEIKENDGKVKRYAVQQMTPKGFRTITISICSEFVAAVYDNKRDAVSLMKLLKKL